MSETGEGERREGRKKKTKVGYWRDGRGREEGRKGGRGGREEG